MTTGDLRSLSRRELVERAEKLGVARAAALTKTELVEAIRDAEDPSSSGRSRTWFGKARDLVARVVEHIRVYRVPAVIDHISDTVRIRVGLSWIGV